MSPFNPPAGLTRKQNEVMRNQFMKPIWKLPFATVLLTLAGCATVPDVHSRNDTSAQINASATFALLPVTVRTNVPAATASAVVAAAQSGARDTLLALGYTEAEREKADLVFYLHGKSMVAETVTDWSYLPEPSKFGLSPSDMTATANRRIFVETYDNHSKHQVWMGWVECSCQKVDPERIQDEIQRIIATFPPRSKAQTSTPVSKTKTRNLQEQLATTTGHGT